MNEAPGSPAPFAHDAPRHADVLARLRESLGRETSNENGVHRWWVNGRAGGKGLAVWLRPAAPHGALAEICEIWITRPYHEEPECCPVTSRAHLEALLQRIHAATHPAAPSDVRGVCPPNVA
jgi:hypothetical protein